MMLDTDMVSTEVIDGLSISATSDDLEWPWMVFYLLQTF